MNLPDLALWAASKELPAPVVRCIRVATLHDFELAWNYRSPGRRGGAANVARAPGRSVPGVVLCIDRATLAALDHKEGHPKRYSRGDAPLAVELRTGGRLDAWVYEVTDEWRASGLVPPRADYLNLLIQGARRFGLPQWHIRSLETTPTAPAA